ncbi:hypothetical protein C7E18_23155, partial [Stenotrophomonas maltophilia]
FSPIEELVAAAPHAGWSGWETFWVLFYAAATWGQCRLPARAGGPASRSSVCSARSKNWWPPRRMPAGAAGKRSGCCSMPPPPG